jgi:uncharacterized protein
MPFVLREFNEDWAIDLNKNLISKGDVKNEDAIKQSIEVILSTAYGERLFNRSFGCGLFEYIFENLNPNTGEQLLTNIIQSIKKWEDRITILESFCKMDINEDDHSIILTIPYTINRSGLVDKFQKKILL